MIVAIINKTTRILNNNVFQNGGLIIMDRETSFSGLQIIPSLLVAFNLNTYFPGCKPE
jgi:hypothetical protein